MKATKYLSLAALAFMGTLASCQSDDEAAVSFARPDNAVGINVTVGSLKGTTRSNPASANLDEVRYFNLGDQVCVSTDGQDPVLFQCQDADMQTWAEAVSGKFLLWTQNEMTFKAYYPATTGTSMTAFTLPADQSTEANIALADYMTRQQTFYYENGTDINLDLQRKTARVIVNIAGFTDQYDEGQQTVSNVRINSQFSAIADGNGQGDITEVTPYMQGTGGQGTSYTALVVPGYDDSGATFITLTDALNNTLTVKGIPELEAGYSYTFNLTVGKNTIQVQSVTVQDWATGTTLAGGQATESPASPFAGVTAEDLGKLIGADGKIYATKAAAETAGTTAVAMIAYVGSSTGDATYNHGLALALTDESSSCMDWNNAMTACTNKNTSATVNSASWMLPSKTQWQTMGATKSTYTTLRDGFTSVGGSNLQSSVYWSSTEVEGSTGDAWMFFFDDNDDDDGWYDFPKSNGSTVRVRACLAF